MAGQSRPYRAQSCPIADALGIIGDRWTILIIRDAQLGVSRFEGFQNSLGVSRNVLAMRLKLLVGAGIFRRRPLRADGRRHEYVLTEKGLALSTVLIALLDWGERWMPDRRGPRAVTVDRDSGRPVSLRLSRDEDGATVTPSEVRILAGPEARRQRHVA